MSGSVNVSKRTHALSYKSFLASHLTRAALLLPGLTGMAPLLAAAPPPDQDFQTLRAQAAAWLEGEIARTFPGVQARARVGPVDDRLRLPACARPLFFLPAGARLWDKGSLGARCAGEVNWSLYLSFENRLRGPALVATQPLPARHAPTAAEVESRIIDYAQAPGLHPRTLPPGTRLSRPVAAGQPILIDMLLLPNVIQAGRKVRVEAGGAGFSVSQEGTALNNAAAGESVKVRMPTGRIVQGIATLEGTVAVAP